MLLGFTVLACENQPWCKRECSCTLLYRSEHRHVTDCHSGKYLLKGAPNLAFEQRFEMSGESRDGELS